MRALKRANATQVCPSAEVIDLAPYLKAVVAQEIGGEKAAYIAHLTHVTDECARKWQRGVAMPNPVHLALLAREFPEIHRAWLRCVEGRGE